MERDRVQAVVRVGGHRDRDNAALLLLVSLSASVHAGAASMSPPSGYFVGEPMCAHW